MRLNRELIAKYNTAGPRYTSYPTAMEFDTNFSAAHYLQALNSLEKQKLSLYLHIPFCRNICYYCACNKVITKDSKKAETYIHYLLKEAKLIANNLKPKQVGQIHFGGGSPTFLTPQQLEYLLAKLAELFEIKSQAEICLEVDPRTVTPEHIIRYRQIGFNRLSIGVQDFNSKVQAAVNRSHSFEQVQNLITAARAQQFDSINLDLINGLPHQTPASFAKTVEQVIQLAPDRIALFNYAHLPHRFKPQRRINSHDLPSAEQKVAMLEAASDQLLKAGYVYIGMDHFALPSDSLTLAQQQGQLQRNFQGYSTHQDHQLIGLGVSSISKVANCYSQNLVSLEQYYRTLDAINVSENRPQSTPLPVWRGYQLSHDDEIRQAVIMSLIANFRLDISAIETDFNIDFKRYFGYELDQLQSFIDDGLIEYQQETLRVTESGRFFIRTICMQFDHYLQELSQLKAYSKVI